MHRLWNRAWLWLLVVLSAGLLLATLVAAPPGTRHYLQNSAILAAGTTLLALPIGTLLAIALLRIEFPGRRAAAATLGVLLFVPLYVQLSGWDAAFGKLGWYTLAFGAVDDALLAGMRGSILVHALAAIPWTALIVGVGLWQIDAAQEEAALLVAPPWRVLFGITLQQCKPFLAAAALWCVVSTASEMTVTNIYLVSTYTEAFYNTFAQTSDATSAAITALPGILGLVLIIGLTLAMLAPLVRRRTLVALDRPAVLWRGGWRQAAAVWIVLAALVGVPVASLVNKAGFIVVEVGGERVRSWSAWKALVEFATAPVRFAEGFGWTLCAAVLAATLALAVAVALAWLARRGGLVSLPAAAAVVLGLAVPGPLVGVGLIWLLNRSLTGSPNDPLIYLYDRTPLAPMLAQAIRALPFVVLVVWHAFASISDDVLDAAALDGRGSLGQLREIALPQRWRMLVAAWILAFAVAAGDIAWSLLVLPPGMDSIQRQVFGLVHSGVEEQVAAISLVIIAAYAMLACVVTPLLAGPIRRRRT